MKRLIPLLLAGATLAFSHPMGNFSVNHYARLEPAARGVDLVYTLDLAEIPTFDLLRSWKLESTSSHPLLEAKAREQATLWLKQLQIRSGAQSLQPRLLSSDLVIADGAGNLPIVRITAKAHVDAAAGSLSYEDLNFPDRAGWKEIVIVAKAGVILSHASQTDKDLSKGLTQYPPDPTVAPPQDLRAELQWSVEKPTIVTSRVTVPPKPVVTPIPQPAHAPAAPSPATLTAAAAPPGALIRGDFLSRLLHTREITPWMMFVGIGAAFILGGAHALTPGHGKTIVAAYLVGSRGTLRHAAFLGAMVTFTHTISVFALGLATLFLFRFIMPEKIAQGLGVVSGLSIVGIGLWMVFKRWRAAAATHEHTHDFHVHHHHGHSHSHSHGAHAHHDHGPSGHTHMPEELSWAGLVALGASGGLVPCESALLLLLGAIAVGKIAFGLMLLVCFSAGLAIVLMAIGAIVLYARNLLPERKHSSNPIFLYAPIASAAIVTIVGLIMTSISLGWIHPAWMIG